MPDVHAGKGAVIGFTATLTDKVIPNVVGVDIGCGVLGIKLGKINVDFLDLDRFIRVHIPNGCKVRCVAYNELPKIIEKDFKLSFAKFYNSVVSISAKMQLEHPYFLKSLGTLGGGNHFIELDKDQDDNVWLIIHSGSRNFGLKIANYHQKIAIQGCGKKLGLEWLEGELALEYINDMYFAQKYAAINRKIIATEICKFLNLKISTLETIESVHNYIDEKDKIIRKGAVSARLNEKVIIPWNMRDGAIIGTGKGNDWWNNSAPHGAGRNMGRNAAKKTLNIDDFKQSMTGIWTSCVNEGTLDEAPMAYKDHTQIKGLIQDTVDIQYVLRPIYNFKAQE
jgi:RNA-splicing ligase RtcB